ncbi:MAG: hypothetical protein LBM07_02895 [Culturomica sp.]|jgi:hypothetical protein|nr:hypothetical protein [Culturomica sp.]
MKRQILLTLFATAYLLVNAQDIHTTIDNFRVSVVESNDLKSKRYLDLIDGSPFLNDEWSEGEVIMRNGKKYTYYMKYMIYNDEIWTSNHEDTIKKLNVTDAVASVLLDGHRFILADYEFKHETKTGLMETLGSAGDFELLKLYTNEFKKATKAGAYKAAERDKFTTKTFLYYRIDEETANLLPKKKADFIALFGEEQAHVKELMDKNKLKVREADILELLKLLN